MLPGAQARARRQLRLPRRVHARTWLASRLSAPRPSVCANAEKRNRVRLPCVPHRVGTQPPAFPLLQTSFPKIKRTPVLSFRHHLGPDPHGQEGAEGEGGTCGSRAAGSQGASSPVGRTLIALVCKGGAEPRRSASEKQQQRLHQTFEPGSRSTRACCVARVRPHPVCSSSSAHRGSSGARGASLPPVSRPLGRSWRAHPGDFRPVRAGLSLRGPLPQAYRPTGRLGRRAGVSPSGVGCSPRSSAGGHHPPHTQPLGPRASSPCARGSLRPELSFL